MTTWTYACEPDARGMVKQLVDTGGDGWKEITDLYRRPAAGPALADDYPECE